MNEACADKYLGSTEIIPFPSNAFILETVFQIASEE